MVKSKRLAWWSGTCFVLCGVALGFSARGWLTVLPDLSSAALIDAAIATASVLIVGFWAGHLWSKNQKHHELEAMFEQTREGLAKLKQLQDAYKAALTADRQLEAPAWLGERKDRH